MNNSKTPRLLLALFLVVLGTVLRVIPHPWNLTPVGAVALFSGATFDRRRWSFLLPLTTLFLGDVALELTTGHGFHSLMPVVYGTFAMIVVFGLLLRDRRDSSRAVGSGAVASATLFFVTTNFAVWASGMTYPMTWAGLVQCYVAGIPYYGTMLAGDLLYSALLFGTFAWAERHVPLFASLPRAESTGQ
jgi:hypothetical protein